MIGNHIVSYENVFCVQRINLDQASMIDWSIACKLTINHDLQRVTWNDGNRGRVVDYDKLSDLTIKSSTVKKDNVSSLIITIKDKRNNIIYELSPLTLDSYEMHIKGRISGHPSFEETSSLVTFFKNLYS